MNERVCVCVRVRVRVRSTVIYFSDIPRKYAFQGH